MGRRGFIQRLFEFFIFGGLLLLGGCKAKEEANTFGNQERLWNLVKGEEKIEEPVEFPFTKETPVFYRDASMGKADPNFVPKIGGG